MKKKGKKMANWTGNEFDDWEQMNAGERATLVTELKDDTSEQLEEHGLLAAWDIYQGKTSREQAQTDIGGIIPEH